MKYVIYLSLLILVGCNPTESLNAVPESKEVVQQFIRGFQSGKYEELYELYGEEFWRAIPQETWAKILPNVKNELGELISCDLVSWNQQTKTSKPSAYYIIHNSKLIYPYESNYDFYHIVDSKLKNYINELS